MKVSPKVENWYSAQLIEIVDKLKELTRATMIPLIQSEIEKIDAQEKHVTDGIKFSEKKLEELRQSFEKRVSEDKERNKLFVNEADRNELSLDDVESQLIKNAKMKGGTFIEKVMRLSEDIVNIFKSDPMQKQYERIAQTAVEMATVDSKEQFKENISKAVGVDVSQRLETGDIKVISSTLNEATNRLNKVTTTNQTLNDIIRENVNLISTIPEQYYEQIINKVREAYISGQAVSGTSPSSDSLAKSLKKIAQDAKVEDNNMNYLATRIARDQMGKIYSDVSRDEKEKSGIKLFKWTTLNDQRVSGKEGGFYPNAEVSCDGISKQKTEHGVGIYRIDQGASWKGKKSSHKALFPGKAHIQCRCVMTPLIEGVNYDPETKEYKKYGV